MRMPALSMLASLPWRDVGFSLPRSPGCAFDGDYIMPRHRSIKFCSCGSATYRSIIRGRKFTLTSLPGAKKIHVEQRFRNPEQ